VNGIRPVQAYTHTTPGRGPGFEKQSVRGQSVVSFMASSVRFSVGTCQGDFTVSRIAAMTPHHERLARAALPRARRVLKMRRPPRSMTWAAIGEALGISRQRAQQLAKKAALAEAGA